MDTIKFRRLLNIIARQRAEIDALENKYTYHIPAHSPIELRQSGIPISTEALMSTRVTTIVPTRDQSLPLQPGIFPFFSLPAELRNMVYDFYFSPEKIYVSNLHTNITDAALQVADERGPLVKLMYSNKTLRHEITGYIFNGFAHQNFVVDTHRTTLLSMLSWENTFIPKEVWEDVTGWDNVTRLISQVDKITIQIYPSSAFLDVIRRRFFQWYQEMREECERLEISWPGEAAEYDGFQCRLFAAFILNFFIEPLSLAVYPSKDPQILVLEIPEPLMEFIAYLARGTNRFPEVLIELRPSCREFREIICRPMECSQKHNPAAYVSKRRNKQKWLEHRHLAGPDPYATMTAYFKAIIDSHDDDDYVVQLSRIFEGRDSALLI